MLFSIKVNTNEVLIDFDRVILFPKKLDKTLSECAKELKREIKANLRSGKFQPLSHWTLITRTKGYGSKPLNVTKSLNRSIKKKKLGKFKYKIYVDKTSRGDSNLTNDIIAQIQEFGITFTMVLTDKQRKFLFAKLKEEGIYAQDYEGASSSVKTITIPPRPFFFPVVHRYVKTRLREKLRTLLEDII